MKHQARILILLIFTLFVRIGNCLCQWSQTFVDQGKSIQCFADSGSKLYAADYSGFLLSLDHGQTWNIINDSIPGQIKSIVVQGNVLYSWLDGLGIIRSIDGGRTWGDVNNGLEDTTYIWSFVIHDTFLFVAIDSEGVSQIKPRIFRSSDSGNTWKEKDNGVVGAINALAVSNGIVFAGTDSGLFRSTDYGTNWGKVSDIHDIVSLIATAGPRIVAQVGNYLVDSAALLYLSTDGGASWRSFSFSSYYLSSYDYFSSIAISGTVLFGSVSRSNGYPTNIYASFDDGKTWIPAAGSDPDRVDVLVVSGPNLLAGSGVIGIWVASLADLGAEGGVSQSSISSSVGILNYPDPTTTTTTISFTLPASSQVTLTLTDAAGRETPLLRAQYLSAGQHEVTWDAGNYPSGVYLCRFSFGGGSATRRVVVMH